jgi:hypothetical protein
MLSVVIRRTHMYLGLFLFPWLLMYSVSTLVMNHRAWFVARYGEGPIPFEKERALVYDGSFPEGADLGTVARQILASVDLDGAHTVTERPNGVIVINRADLVTPRRLTYSRSDRTLVIERQQHRTNALLERFHRRRGYATGYALDTAWAVSVDLAIAGLVFWVVSGLWMWWEMRATRGYGAMALLSGLGLFGMSLMTL